MKLLAKLEKNTTFWAVFAICIVFTLLRLPSLIEPYWYGDEAVYEVVGQALSHGELLYRDIWDNKPPLLYVIYALFQGSQQDVKIFSLIIGLVSVIVFFFLAREIFNKRNISILTTALFALLFATPVLEANIANAEDFLLLPILFAALLVYKFTVKKHVLMPKSLFIAGIILGVAFLIKIVAIFDFTAFLIFLVIFSGLRNGEQLQVEKTKVIHGLMIRYMSDSLFRISSFTLSLLSGFLIPFICTVLFFTANHAVADFFQAVFSSNVGYVGFNNSLLGIPQGLLLLKIIGLAAVMTLVVKKHQTLTKATLFILLWLTFSLFNVYFSGRPYTHYAIVLIPSFSLFIGLLWYYQSFINKAIIFIATIFLVILLSQHFSFNPSESVRYYQNFLQFVSGKKTVEAYQSYFDPSVPRDYILASFIATHTTSSETVFIWGNSPEIYVLSHKLPIGKYTVAYHIQQNNAYAQTQQLINKKGPKYIIVLTESQPLPFVVPLYIMRYTIPGATIYERSI